jgi:uncharacterized protein YndB with AHSA1/START domain
MTDDAPFGLTLVRRFAASPERVFDAWTKAEIAACWLFTGPASETHSTEFDLTVGGTWTITDRREGVDYTAIGEYLEIDRPRRLVFTFGMPQFSPEFDTVVVTIEADGDGSIMTLVQEKLPAAMRKPTEDGWSEMFAALGEALGSAPASR